jgi:hypothetical protein
MHSAWRIGFDYTIIQPFESMIAIVSELFSDARRIEQVKAGLTIIRGCVLLLLILRRRKSRDCC